MRQRPLLTLFVSALLVRLIVLFTGPWTDPTRIYAYSPDSPRYVALADTLITHRAFGKPAEDGLMHLAVEQLRAANGTLPPPDANGLYPEAFRTPGYPVFLAFFGGTPGLHFALLAQCVLGAFAAGCLVHVARAMDCRPQAAQAAGWMWALHPAVVTTDLLPLTESLFCTLGIVALSATIHTHTASGRILPGLLIGTASLVRPLGLIYLPTALLLGWKTTSRKWLTAGIMTCAAVAPSAVWAIRNGTTGNGYRISTVGSLNLYFYGVAYSISEERGEDWFTSWPARVEELSQRLKARLHPGQDVYTLAQKEALIELGARPTATAKVAAKSQIKLALDHSVPLAAGLYGVDYKPSGFLSHLLRGRLDTLPISPGGLLALLWMVLNALLILAALVGLVRATRHRCWILVAGCLVPIVLFSGATFPVGLERFRLPMMPVLFALAVCAIWSPKPLTSVQLQAV